MASPSPSSSPSPAASPSPSPSFIVDGNLLQLFFSIYFPPEETKGLVKGGSTTGRSTQMMNIKKVKKVKASVLFFMKLSVVFRVLDVDKSLSGGRTSATSALNTAGYGDEVITLCESMDNGRT
ncbi:hypothetical protein L6452_38552 [Arctium lappa]|uniref:Uncharacterized protein n=1 Tax=Arctium lappa TaxID=4217 RepID=A0ACB8XQ27_ARCLA|nr:hypothetical protein L6452_38552 [Arctium lappa]